MESFRVVSYRVELVQFAPVQESSYRQIIVSSDENLSPHGGFPGRTLGYLWFTDSWSSQQGYVMGLRQPEPHEIQFWKAFPKAEFPLYYDILRNEASVYIWYEAISESSPDAESGYLELGPVRMYTGIPEPPGDGPRDFTP
jgi:hypothetical protein